jgi:hypothetical protein
MRRRMQRRLAAIAFKLSWLFTVAAAHPRPITAGPSAPRGIRTASDPRHVGADPPFWLDPGQPSAVIRARRYGASRTGTYLEAAPGLACTRDIGLLARRPSQGLRDDRERPALSGACPAADESLRWNCGTVRRSTSSSPP